MKNKLFLSHSSKDSNVVTAFVEFMYQIGLTEENIICTSAPQTKIPVGDDIYEHLNELISEEDIYVIYFLSDNFYASPVCLNEMGAFWLKKSESLNLLLPGFNFEDIRGVIEKNKVAIRLGTCDSMTKAAFNDFRKILKAKFGINPSLTNWEIARDKFLQSTLEDTKNFNMTFSRSYCIGDLENEGCKIIKKESGNNIITAVIDFGKTESKLCSIVIFNGSKDFTNYYINRKNLCFEAYADDGINCMDVEIKFKDIDMPYEISLDEDEKEYKLPLSQFCDYLQYWKTVSEIKFVFHRKKVLNKGKVIIKNFRLE